MSNRSYDGEPFDASWQSDLKDAQRDGETVDATPKDNAGNEQTSVWPSMLPNEPFVRGMSKGESKQSKVVKALAQFPDRDDQSISDYVGCSESQVAAVRHKVSVFVPPDAVGFEIPDQPDPSRSSLAKYALGDDGARFDKTDFGLNTSTTAGDGDSGDPGGGATAAAGGGDPSDLDSHEICRRFYANGESAEEIAADLGVSDRNVTGRLNAWKSTDHNDRAELDAWPMYLPKKALGPKQAEAFEYWLANPDADKKEVANAVDTTTRTVGRVRQRVRCYTTESDGLPFELPEEPSAGLAEHALDVYREREGPLSFDEVHDGGDEGTTDDGDAEGSEDNEHEGRGAADDLRDQLDTLSENVKAIDSAVADRLDEIDSRVAALEDARESGEDTETEAQDPAPALGEVGRLTDELQRRRQASVLTRFKWWLVGGGSE